MDELPKPKAPLEKIITKLKELEKETEPKVAIHVDDVTRLVQTFMRELEHEKAHAVVQIIQNCHSMDRVEYFRGRLAMIKTMQRDYNQE